MPAPSESSTPTVYGDLIREFVVTRPDGTQVKVQGIAVVDASTVGNVAAVTAPGGGASGYSALVVEDNANNVPDALLNELRAIRYGIQVLVAQYVSQGDTDAINLMEMIAADAA